MKLKYLSHGVLKTGGYRHEKFMFESVVNKLELPPNEYQIERLPKHFNHLLAYVYLMVWGFVKSNAEINIVVSRLALSALLRNWFNRNQVWIVLHNFDENDQKSKLMKRYYSYLFKRLRKVKHNRFKVITVADYWQQYLTNEQHLPNVKLFPNLFDPEFYTKFHKEHKNAWVHLGQYSSKNHEDIYRLAKVLTQDGFYCYFSTLDSSLAKPFNGQFEIIYFHSFNDYLDQVSRSMCTVCLIKVNEGWNRLAHESILIGTPVLGYGNGGLGELLKKSHSIIVQDIDEAYTCIKASLFMLPESSFFQDYHTNKAQDYLKQVMQ